MKKQFFRFIIVGMLAAIVDLGTLKLLEITTTLNKYLIVTISYSLGLICNFVLSKNFTFQAQGNSYKQFVFFTAVSLLNLMLTMIIIFILTNYLSLSLFYSRIGSLVITTPIVFLINKFLTFSKAMGRKDV